MNNQISGEFPLLRQIEENNQHTVQNFANVVLYSLSSLESIQEVCLKRSMASLEFTGAFQTIIKNLFSSKNPVDIGKLMNYFNEFNKKDTPITNMTPTLFLERLLKYLHSENNNSQNDEINESIYNNLQDEKIKKNKLDLYKWYIDYIKNHPQNSFISEYFTNLMKVTYNSMERDKEYRFVPSNILTIKPEILNEEYPQAGVIKQEKEKRMMNLTQLIDMYTDLKDKVPYKGSPTEKWNKLLLVYGVPRQNLIINIDRKENYSNHIGCYINEKIPLKYEDNGKVGIMFFQMKSCIFFSNATKKYYSICLPQKNKGLKGIYYKYMDDSSEVINDLNVTQQDELVLVFFERKEVNKK